MKRTGCGRFIAELLLLVGVLVGTISVSWAQVPTEADVYVDRGIVAYDNKQYGEALQGFQEALRLSPDNINALYYTGLTYMALQQYSAAQAVLEQAQKLAPGDPDVAFQLGVAHFLQQQYDKAEPILRQVYASQPQHPNLGYYLGFMEYRKQAYQEALHFFRATVPSDESFAQLTRFYTSLSLAALGFAGQARDEIEEALRLQPASPLTASAERFKEVLGPAVKAERNFHVDAKVGVYYDTNVAVVPGPSGDIVAQAAAQAPHRSPGELGYVRFEYLPLRTPDWEASIATSLLQTVNNDVSGFNTTDVTGAAALAYKTKIGNTPTVAGLSFTYDYFALSGHKYLNQYTATPFMSLVWDAMNLTQAQFRFQAQDLMNQNLVTPADNRDGFDYLAGVIHFFRFQGDQHYIKLGYQFDWDKTKGSNWTYLGNRFLVGFQYTLPWWGIRVRDDFDAHLKDYTHLHDYLPAGCAPCIHRSDQELNNLLSVSKDLPYNVTLSLEYLLDRNMSNLALYDYTRHVISFNVSWRY
jgi:outer membrane protein assembly factor BamD (BamD/ComL family)